ncbi:MAG: cytochrome c [Nitrospinae bacterium]|nr:cytochrome c [Nitrospinota bacterium]MBI5747584.1 cytochrome c [Nitrospinota bacterium]
MKVFNLNLFRKCIIVLFLICFPVGTIYLINRAEAQEAEKDYTKSRSGKKDDIKSNYYGYCSPCHGDTGKGDGPLAETLEQGVEPRDHTSAEYFSQKTDEDIFNVIKFGGAKAGFSEAMPPFDGQLSDDEMHGLVKYIRILCKCKFKK